MSSPIKFGSTQNEVRGVKKYFDHERHPVQSHPEASRPTSAGRGSRRATRTFPHHRHPLGRARLPPSRKNLPTPPPLPREGEAPAEPQEPSHTTATPSAGRGSRRAGRSSGLTGIRLSRSFALPTGSTPMARQSLPRTGFRVDPEIGWLRCLSVAASHGFQTFRPARRNRSNPPKKIVERIGCELRNRFGTSDPSPSGDARGNVVPRRWPTSGQGAACFGDPSPQQQGALRAAPQTTGKQPFRPELQKDARHKPTALRNALPSGLLHPDSTNKPQPADHDKFIPAPN